MKKRRDIEGEGEKDERRGEERREKREKMREEEREETGIGEDIPQLSTPVKKKERKKKKEKEKEKERGIGEKRSESKLHRKEKRVPFSSPVPMEDWSHKDVMLFLQSLGLERLKKV